MSRAFNWLDDEWLDYDLDKMPTEVESDKEFPKVNSALYRKENV